jgi:sarcosine oxidase, subunit beta
MVQTADVIVVGAGVHGVSVAFHLARKGVRVLVLERGTLAAGATGRSSGFVRMHYDFESDARLAWSSFPYFRDWSERVGVGDCGFVRTGFLQLVPPSLTDALRANVAVHQRIGIASRVIDRTEVAALLPGIVTADIDAAAYEPESGYADPSGTAAGFMAAARRDGAQLVQNCQTDAVLVAGGRVTGVQTNQGIFSAPVVVDAAGAWAGQLASTVGLTVPIEPWRHDTAYFGLPTDHQATFPIVIDEAGEVYFRPEGRGLMLVGLESGNVIGGSPDRPMTPLGAASTEALVRAVCGRVPWMAGGTFRTAHGGQDGITPDQHPIIDQAGPEGFYLDCGFSGTGFKTAPAVGAALAERIHDGRSTTADISAYTLERFAQGRHLVGDHPYGMIWR